MKIGFSNTPPKSEALPLGTKRRRTSKRADAARRKVKRATRDEAVRVQNPIDTDTSSVVESSHASIPMQEVSRMELSLKALTKNGKSAIYTGLRTAVRINLVSFVNSVAPASLELSGDVLGPKEKKHKLTKEERAALPPMTKAEKIARAEARLAKMRAAL